MFIHITKCQYFRLLRFFLNRNHMMLTCARATFIEFSIHKWQSFWATIANLATFDNFITKFDAISFQFSFSVCCRQSVVIVVININIGVSHLLLFSWGKFHLYCYTFVVHFVLSCTFFAIALSPFFFFSFSFFLPHTRILSSIPCHPFYNV